MTAQRILAISITTFLATASGGCFVTTKHEGDVLRTDIARIDKRVAAQEDTLGSKVEQLKKVLDEATKLLARNSADVGAEVSALGEEQRRLNGLVQDARRLSDDIKTQADRQDIRLSELEQRVAALETKTSAPPPKTASELYSEGVAAMSSGDYDRAKAVFRTLVVKYPDDGKADDAQFRRGEANAKQGNLQEALAEFQKVFEKYPSSPLADQALFRAGESAESLKWCTDARAYFGLLRQKFPKSNLVKKAKDKDAKLKKAAKDKNKCQS
jgi:tol-pal system protein YbgF